MYCEKSRTGSSSPSSNTSSAVAFPKAGQRISDGKRHLRVKANANGQPRPIVQRPNAVAANGFKQMSRPPQILKKGPEPSVCYGKRNMCF